METLIEQLKAHGFVYGAGNETLWCKESTSDVMVMPYAGRVAVCVCVHGTGQIDRWFSGDVTIEQVEAFIARARRIIAEWDTMEVSFQGGAE